jgi:hypothetical protein
MTQTLPVPRPRLSLVPPQSPHEEPDMTPQPVHINPPELTPEVAQMARILGPRHAELLLELWQATWSTVPAGLASCPPETPVTVMVPAGLLSRLVVAGAVVADVLDDREGGDPR